MARRACEIRCWTMVWVFRDGQKPLNTAVENRFEKCPQMRELVVVRTRFAKLRKMDG